MKTQLLEDLDESGSAAQAPGQGAAARPGPAVAAVWHRPQASNTPGQRSSPPGPSAQHAGAGAMGGLTGAASGTGPSAGQMRPPGGQAMQDGAAWSAAQARQRAPEGAWSGPRPLPQDAKAAATHAHADPFAPAAIPPPLDPPAADMPDWLAERLREDAEQEDRRQRSRLVTRRAVGWSAAATVAAMLAVAGYWFYQDSRVDGALNVVAGTTPAAHSNAVLAPKPAATPASVPAPAASVPDPSALATSPQATPGAPAAQPDAMAEATPAPVAVAAPRAPAARAPGVSDETTAHGARTHKRARTVADRAGAALDNIDGPLHRSTPAAHRKHVQAEPRVSSADAPAADGEPTPSQRREETLMQCRVLGYDERECTRRACAMTRFGLVCPG